MGGIDVERALATRETFAGGWDDSSQVAWLAGIDVDVVRGRGRLAGERTVAVDTADGGRLTLTARRAVVVATPQRGVAAAAGGRSRHRHRRPAMRATWNGAVLAESDDTVVVEGNHYLPRSAVAEQDVSDSATRSTCPWKGQAAYLTIEVDGQVDRDAAWYYPEPKAAAAQIEDRIAFWRGVRVE